MTTADAPPESIGSNIAHKAAAIALGVVAAIVALIIYVALGPDPAEFQACYRRALAAGGSGQAVHCESNLRYLVPFLIVMAAAAGIRRVWR